MPSRRTFLKHSAVALTAATTALPSRPLLAQLGHTPEPLPPIQDPRVKSLSDRALDVARSAGAQYADVRLVHTRVRWIGTGVEEFEWMTVGVRALVKGYWGFAASPIWSPDEMARLAKQAVHQAKAGSLGETRPIELAPLTQVAQGHWDMPVAIDPFTVPINEILDYKKSLDFYAAKRAKIRGYVFSSQGIECIFVSHAKAFGSTDGSYCTQHLVRTSGSFPWELSLSNKGKTRVVMDRLTPAGLGWELFREQPLRDYTDQAIEEAIEDLTLPTKPVDIGRHDTVWDASSVADVASSTLGAATEVDRVFGYEANATGTSYFNQPLEMLGSYTVGSSLLNVTANRTEAGGVTTVKWDDDGVTPQDFTVVKQGVLTNFATTRESAAWLNDYYAKTGQPVQSNGCALGSQDLIGRGMNMPIPSAPNLVVSPGTGTWDFDQCVANMTKGLAFRRITSRMDFQQLNGLGIGGVTYEVRNGKRVAIVTGAGVLLRAPEFWKSLTVLGGSASTRRFGKVIMKGEPPQWGYHSVSAVPAIFTGTVIVDVMRKA
jgi:TldD protein